MIFALRLFKVKWISRVGYNKFYAFTQYSRKRCSFSTPNWLEVSRQILDPHAYATYLFGVKDENFEREKSEKDDAFYFEKRIVRDGWL